MKPLLARLLGRDGGLQEGALVGVLYHAKGTLFEPYERRITARGPGSNEAMEPEYWSVLAPDTDAPALGEAALAAFDRVRTVEGNKDGMWGRPGYADEVRAALGLKPRAALWSAAGKVTLSVDAGDLILRPMQPEGRSGAFTFMKGHGVPALALKDVSAERLGARLMQARDLVLPRR